MVPNNRRVAGGPHYDLQKVQQLARAKKLYATGRALRDDAPRVLPLSVIDHIGAIRSTVLALRDAHWRFAETNHTGTVDVYRIERHGRPLWVKIKLEIRNGSDHVIVISFHEWDDARPI